MLQPPNGKNADTRTTGLLVLYIFMAAVICICVSVHLNLNGQLSQPPLNVMFCCATRAN